MTDYKVQCDVSGQVVLASQTRMTYDGKRVYYKYWYEQHPQELMAKPINEIIAVKNPRPRNLVDVSLTGYVGLE
jgi:hypothetical protein